MTIHALGVDELLRLHEDPGAVGPWAGPVARDVVVVDLEEIDGSVPTVGVPCAIPVVVVGTTRPGADLSPVARELCDVVAAPGGQLIGQIAATVERNPVSSLALVTLLRRSGGLSVSQGLLVESAVYGTLQAGEEFAAWRRSVPRRPGNDMESAVLVPATPPVLAVRHDDQLHLTLNRPERRNVFDASMRDVLAEQLTLALLDTTIHRVRLDGAGAGFCSGGDLDEFGTATDPAVAHVLRLERSVGWLIDRIRDRATVTLHGACVGSGIELAAFAAHVVADPSTSISLPEVSMGLIPGAGGTVSLVRRVGRHRVCELALSGRSIDARTALEWGLVDVLGGH